MDNKNTLLEWNIHRAHINIKRNYKAIIVLVFIAFIILSNFIHIWIALICGFLILYIIAKYYINVQNKYQYITDDNMFIEKYKITDEGIAINNLVSNTASVYKWSDMDCFYAKAITLGGRIISIIAGDDFIIEKNDGQTIKLRCGADVMPKVGNVLSQKLPFKNKATNTKRKLDLVENNNSINVTKRKNNIISKIIVALILPVIMLVVFYKNSSGSIDFKETLKKDEVSIIFVGPRIGDNIAFEADDEEFGKLIQRIYNIETNQSLLEKIELYFFPESLVDEKVEIYNEIEKSLNQNVFNIELCKEDHFCVIANYNIDTKKIMFQEYNFSDTHLNWFIEKNRKNNKNIKYNVDRLDEANKKIILKSYQVDLNDIMEWVGETQKENALDLSSKKFDEYWYERGWPRDHRDMIACNNNIDCELYYYSEGDYDLEHFREMPQSERVMSVKDINGCWWTALSTTFKELWWKRYPKPDKCKKPEPSEIEVHCSPGVGICVSSRIK